MTSVSSLKCYRKLIISEELKLNISSTVSNLPHFPRRPFLCAHLCLLQLIYAYLYHAQNVSP